MVLHDLHGMGLVQYHIPWQHAHVGGFAVVSVDFQEPRLVDVLIDIDNCRGDCRVFAEHSSIQGKQRRRSTIVSRITLE